MSDKIVRMNIRVPRYLQEWYKVQADKYSVPYTNYISMLLTQIYEKEIGKELLKDLTTLLKEVKDSSGDFTVEEIEEMLQQLLDIIVKKNNKEVKAEELKEVIEVDLLIEQLKKDNTIEQLQEIGKINIDYIDEELELLIDVLDKHFNIKTELQDLVGGRYLVNIDYKVN